MTKQITKSSFDSIENHRKHHKAERLWQIRSEDELRKYILSDNAIAPSVSPHVIELANARGKETGRTSRCCINTPWRFEYFRFEFILNQSLVRPFIMQSANVIPTFYYYTFICLSCGTSKHMKRFLLNEECGCNSNSPFGLMRRFIHNFAYLQTILYRRLTHACISISFMWKMR